MPDPKNTVKVVVTPRFRSLNAKTDAGSLAEHFPTVVQTELARAQHLTVVARADALELLTQTVQRIASRDFIEANTGGTVNLVQHLHIDLSKEDRNELGDLLEADLRSRLLALGVDCLVYGKFFEPDSNELRIDVYLLDLNASVLRAAERVQKPRSEITLALEAMAANLARAVAKSLEGKSGDKRRLSMAVLPFQNVSGEARWNLWREGLTEELIIALRNARDLQLFDRGRGSKYKNVDQDDLDLTQVGRDLNVDLLLLGRFDVREKDQRVKIYARLVRTEDAELLASFKVEGPLEEDVQAALALEIMQKLEVKPASVEEVRATPVAVSARENVRIGVHYFDAGTLDNALHHFREALAAEPDFSEAHYHLGVTYHKLKLYDDALRHLEKALGVSAERPFGQLRWSVKLGSKIFVRPLIHGQHVYIAAEGGDFYCFDKSTADPVWRRKLPDITTENAALMGERIIVPGHHSVHALNLKTGDAVWESQLEGEVDGPVQWDGPTVCVMTNTPWDSDSEEKHGRVYGLDAATGQQRWVFDLDSEVGQLLAVGGRLYFGDRDRKMRCLSLETGQVLWSTAAPGEPCRTPVTDGKRIYAVATIREGDDTSGAAIAFDVATGAIEWQLATDEPGSTTPWLSRDILFAGFGKSLYAIDRARGLLQWRYHAGFPIGAVDGTDDLVFVTARFLSLIDVGEHALLALDRGTQQPYWKHTFGDIIYGEMTIDGGTLYIGNRNHYLFAFNIERGNLGLVRSADIWNCIGLIQSDQGRPQQAIDAFQESIRLNPVSRQGHRNLVDLYRAQGRMAKAIGAWQRYLDLLPAEERELEMKKFREFTGVKWIASTRRLLPMMLMPVRGDVDSSSIVPSPLPAQEKVFVGGSDGAMRAFDAATGAEVWKFSSVPQPKSIRSSAVSVKDWIIYGDGDGHLCARQAVDGRLIWQYTAGGRIDSTPVVHAGVCYVGSDDQAVHAIDVEKGTELWKFPVKGPVKSAPTISDGTLYFSSHDGGVYAVDPASHELRWHFQTEDIINSSPQVAEGRVYVGPDDRFIYCLDATTGELKWKYKVKEESRSVLRYGLREGGGLNTFGFLPSTPVIRDGIVYVGSNGESPSQMYALDAATGRPCWRYRVTKGEVGSPTLYGHVLFFGAGGVLFHDLHLYALDARDGSLLWQFRLTGDLLSAPALQEGALYCWCLSGDVYAFDVNGIAALIPERDATFHLQQGQILLENQERNVALAPLRRACELEPDNAEAWAQLADCYEGLGQAKPQEETLLHLRQIDKTATHTYWRLANLYLGQHKFKESITELETFIKLHDDFGKAFGHQFLGRVHQANGEPERALAEFDDSIRLAAQFLRPSFGTDSERSGAWQILFTVLENKGDLLSEKKERLAAHIDWPALQEALDQSQDPDKYAHAILGLIHAQDKNYPEAAAEYEASLARDPDDTLLLLRAGALRLDKTFDFEAGYRHFARLLDLSPEDPSSELNLAEAALTLDRWADCRNLTTSVLQRSLDLSGALNAKWLRWMASLLLGESGQARVDWQALADAAAALPDDFQNNWDYGGARHYLEHLARVDAEKRATLQRVLEAMQAPVAELRVALQQPASG